MNCFCSSKKFLRRRHRFWPRGFELGVQRFDELHSTDDRPRIERSHPRLVRISLEYTIDTNGNGSRSSNRSTFDIHDRSVRRSLGWSTSMDWEEDWRNRPSASDSIVWSVHFGAESTDRPIDDIRSPRPWRNPASQEACRVCTTTNANPPREREERTNRNNEWNHRCSKVDERTSRCRRKEIDWNPIQNRQSSLPNTRVMPHPCNIELDESRFPYRKDKDNRRRSTRTVGIIRIDLVQSIDQTSVRMCRSPCLHGGLQILPLLSSMESSNFFSLARRQTAENLRFDKRSETFVQPEMFPILIGHQIA